MGYIYRIVNKITEESYIGQTVKIPEKRFQQHRNNYTKDYFSQIVLYKAFKKYGLENFDFQVIEQCADEELDNKEKYWIAKFDSYYNGYNSTLGGRATQLYDWDEPAIIELYMQLKSARKVAEQLGCDHSTIDDILNKNKIRRFTQAEQKAKTIYLYKNGKELVFDNPTEAAKWLINNKYVKSKNVRSVRSYLTNNYLKHKTYYGYEISYESKIQSVPLATEE